MPNLVPTPPEAADLELRKARRTVWRLDARRTVRIVSAVKGIRIRPPRAV